MNKIIDICKDKLNIPTLIILIALLIGGFNLFSYLIPFTDNAFVVANNQIVAADVSGYVSEIYVKNGQRVTKDSPLFKVFDTPYKLALVKSKAAYEQAVSALEEQQQTIKKDDHILEEAQANLDKANYDYKLKSAPDVGNSVAEVEIKNALYSTKSLKAQVNANKIQRLMDDQQLIQKQKQLEQAKANMDSDVANLKETIVRAGANGVVDNMFLAIGSPVSAHQALFSFVNTDSWYVQANFNETDLRHVRPGDKAKIILRMYYFDKIYHGEIVNNIWVTDRQSTTSRSQQQTISSNNEWLNLPQRVPVLIKISDPDSKYPLNPGVSAYVYIQTRN